jgi:hypothetical protein
MAYFFKRRSKERYPVMKPVSVPVSGTDLLIQLWDRQTDTGRRIHWSVARANSETGEVYKTLRPENLLEVPRFIIAASRGFAQVPELPKELTAELTNLVTLMEPIAARLEANGESTPIEDGEKATIPFG